MVFNRMTTCKKKVWGFNDIPLMIMTIPVVAVMVQIILFRDVLMGYTWTQNLSCLLVSLIYVCSFWFMFREIHYRAAKKYPSFTEPRKRYMYLIVGGIIGYIMVDVVVDLFTWFFLKPMLNITYKPSILLEIISSVIFSSLFVILYEAMYLSNQLKKSIIEKEKLVKENLTSQLEGLRSQVNPHFLFNSLNTLSSLIPEDPKRANRFVSQMSKVYRYILEFRNEEVVSVKDELDFIEAYAFMVKERFQDNIQIEKDIPTEYHDYHMVPLSLQLLFENAIKHNIISKDKPLTIKVYVHDMHIVIENNLQAKQTVPSSTKVGLKNIKDRYEFFTDQQVKVNRDQKYFSVRLPLFRNKTDKSSETILYKPQPV